jgi:hypothetical protein
MPPPITTMFWGEECDIALRLDVIGIVMKGVDGDAE